MTDKQSITITDEDGVHKIIITPINVSAPGGGVFSTGQYKLTEGSVGIGLMTIDEDLQWDWEGSSDFDADQLTTIANFIIGFDKPLLSSSAPGEDPGTDIINGSEAFGFTLENGGNSLDIQVIIHYPLYDVLINGQLAAQLQQDHHSNWFVASGDIEGDLVQPIGERIAAQVAG